VKLRHPFVIRVIALLSAWLIRLWMRTLRYRMVFLDGRNHPADARRERYIYAFWHDSLLFPVAFKTRVYVLISQHADGELIAQACHHLGYGLVRGSQTRGSTQALMQMCRAAQHSHLLVTPDGPRGPRRCVKPGMVFVASHTGLPIVVCGVAYPQAWRAKSWDRFAVPKPWTEAICVVAPAIRVPADLDRLELERYRQLVEAQMLHVTAEAERRAGLAPEESALKKAG
jgi:lysophospholipid acyltransferase (LPLAT)-like uncharacterized protein